MPNNESSRWLLPEFSFEGLLGDELLKSQRRGLSMPDRERAAREQRRLRYKSRLGIEGKQSKEPRTRKGPAETSSSAVAQTPDLQGTRANELTQSSWSKGEDISIRKPWESLVIGDLGENLSYIEEKDREVEQQRFIIKHYEENAPHQVDHHRQLLEQLLWERADLDDNDEENNMPEEKREERDRIAERISSLNWALDTCQCKDEEANIRAAIQGYHSGQIAYSRSFTLIYAGEIVDVCPTYRSFCEDREERLDRYAAQHGPGWLWHEPPLAYTNSGATAKKGLGLDRTLESGDSYGIGNYPIDLRFTVDISKVSRGKKRTSQKVVSDTSQASSDTNTWCQFKTILDSGATFPILNKKDLRQLDFDPERYASQGLMCIHTVDSKVNFKFYEMYVTVCSEEGEPLVGEGDEAVWPTQPRALGGFCPVQIDPKEPHGRVQYSSRLSGMIPFEACYISSAPTMRKIWFGEDRRDVLGASRMPGQLRFDPERTFHLDCPTDLEKLRQEAGTPDQVIFAHSIDGEPGSLFTDTDLAGPGGKSELAIIHGGQSADGNPIVLARKKVQIEPRSGTFKEGPRRHMRWRDSFLDPDELDFENKDPAPKGKGKRKGKKRVQG